MASGFSVKDALNKNSKEGLDEAPKARFRTKDISIFKMYQNKLNFYSVEEIEELAADIYMCGLKQNLELVYDPCDKGEYRIIAGERRWLALKMLVEKGHKEFEMATSKLTTPQDEDEEQIEVIIANAYRTKSITDLIEEENRLKISLERMKAEGKKIKGYDLQSGRLRDVIASMLRTSKTKIAQIEAVNNNLIPEWKKELKGERLSFSAAYELSGMPEDKQREILEKYTESGEITHKDIKEMKSPKAAVDENANNMEFVSESDTNEDNKAAVEEYQTPHPENITSLCYSCTEYETCNLKSSICTNCDRYNNRAEAYKTDEQRYDEEQAKIDKETAKKLRDMEDEKKMEKLPSDLEPRGSKVHQIKLGAEFFEDSVNNKKGFEIRKKDRDYRVGDILEMVEYKNGATTGRTVIKQVTYILEDYTGLEDGYCIMSVAPVNENGEPLQYADIEQICRDIEANGDGYTEYNDEIILSRSAVNIVRGLGL